MTNLIAALKSRNYETVIAIFGQPTIDAEGSDENESGALHIAAQIGWLEAVQHLVARGAVVDRRNKFGATPLFFAAREGHETVVAYLLEADADPHIANQNNVTPHDIASHKNHTRVAQLIGQVAARKRPQNKTDNMLNNILNRKKAS